MMRQLRVSALCLLGVVLGAAGGFAQPIGTYDPPVGTYGPLPLAPGGDEVSGETASGLAPDERPALSAEQVAAETAKLRAELRRSVGRAWRHSPSRDHVWISRARE